MDEEISKIPRKLPRNRFITGSDIGTYRDSLVECYRDRGHRSVLSRIREGGDEVTSDEILGLIVDEMLQGGEEMLGTQLMLEEEGNLAASTATTVKRSELLKGVADIVAKRKELNQRASDIDLNSPAFMIFQKICFDNLIKAMDDLQMDEEMVSLIVQKFTDNMKDWGKVLKQKLDEMAQ